jgi:hypothetical protein
LKKNYNQELQTFILSIFATTVVADASTTHVFFAKKSIKNKVCNPGPFRRRYKAVERPEVVGRFAFCGG